MSSFSVNGSPTWTLGRESESSSSEKVALASTETPPMPSRPVLAPKRITTLPTPLACMDWRRSRGRTPTLSALTSGLPW